LQAVVVEQLPVQVQQAARQVAAFPHPHRRQRGGDEAVRVLAAFPVLEQEQGRLSLAPAVHPGRLPVDAQELPARQYPGRGRGAAGKDGQGGFAPSRLRPHETVADAAIAAAIAQGSGVGGAFARRHGMAVGIAERGEHLVQRAVEAVLVGLGDRAGASFAGEAGEAGGVPVEQPPRMAHGGVVGCCVQSGALCGAIGHLDAGGQLAAAGVGNRIAAGKRRQAGQQQVEQRQGAARRRQDHPFLQRVRATVGARPCRGQSVRARLTRVCT